MIHGTTHGYNKGCRCGECRAAKSEANRKMRESNGKKSINPPKVEIDFDFMFKMLMYLKNVNDWVSVDELVYRFNIQRRQLNKVLREFEDGEYIVSKFVQTGFQDGYYAYMVSATTILSMSRDDEMSPRIQL